MYARAATSGGFGIGAAARAGPPASVDSASRDESASRAVDERNIRRNPPNSTSGVHGECQEGGDSIEFPGAWPTNGSQSVVRQSGGLAALACLSRSASVAITAINSPGSTGLLIWTW